jgi:hypothetical protein
MKDLDFIKRYKKVKTLGELCKQEKVHYSNLIAGQDKKNEKKIAILCKLEIIKLYHEIIEDVITNDTKTDTL